MPRADRLKEEIGWLKVAFGIGIALDASVVAWLAQNYSAAAPVILTAAVVVAVAIAAGIILINRRAYSRIEELEDV